MSLGPLLPLGGPGALRTQSSKGHFLQAAPQVRCQPPRRLRGCSARSPQGSQPKRVRVGNNRVATRRAGSCKKENGKGVIYGKLTNKRHRNS
ncbi:hypothetical protein NPIL_237551 [Nephila pilipes]|uniref:Uncharacterized protein n=1 Tax=Nephila pilipes TaxID=299642 RepID=A0A8X6R4W0_NEPPI|nr:hypothetical protein NPIL_237551 [Nephila pilipes]